MVSPASSRDRRPSSSPNSYPSPQSPRMHELRSGRLDQPIERRVEWREQCGMSARAGANCGVLTEAERNR